MRKNLRFGIDNAPPTNNAPLLPTSQQPVTHKELEAAGQQCLRFRLFSVEDEQRALNWWAARILQAEASNGNSEASQRPAKYVQDLKFQIVTNEKVLLGVVEEWQMARKTGTLDEPIWSNAMRPKKAFAASAASTPAA